MSSEGKDLKTDWIHMWRTNISGALIVNANISFGKDIQSHVSGFKSMSNSKGYMGT